MNTPQYAITPSDRREAQHAVDEFLGQVTLQEQMPTLGYSPRGAYRCPPWARWLAVDSDGTVWAYAERPQLQLVAGCWAPFHARARFELVDHVPPTTAWRDSLVSVPGNDAPTQRLHALIVAGLLVLALGTFAVGTLAGWW
jgi:hypothetical protein